MTKKTQFAFPIAFSLIGGMLWSLNVRLTYLVGGDWVGLDSAKCAVGWGLGAVGLFLFSLAPIAEMKPTGVKFPNWLWYVPGCLNWGVPFAWAFQCRFLYWQGSDIMDAMEAKVTAGMCVFAAVAGAMFLVARHVITSRR